MLKLSASGYRSIALSPQPQRWSGISSASADAQISRRRLAVAAREQLVAAARALSEA